MDLVDSIKLGKSLKRTPVKSKIFNKITDPIIICFPLILEMVEADVSNRIARFLSEEIRNRHFTQSSKSSSLTSK